MNIAALSKVKKTVIETVMEESEDEEDAARPNTQRKKIPYDMSKSTL
jgi:hypothetical protein